MRKGGEENIKGGGERLSIIARVLEISATLERHQQHASKFVSICECGAGLFGFLFLV